MYSSQSIYIDLVSGEYVSVQCFDWSKEIGYVDNLRLHLGEREFKDWLTNEAY
mgnify:CR=1 FL=1